MKETGKEKPRYTDTELQEFKAIIEAKLQAARENVAQLKEELLEYTDNYEDEIHFDLSDGTDSSIREHYNIQIARGRKFIESLTHALNRIENRTYGICRATGKLISKERLKAVPHATLSIDAKNQQQKEAFIPLVSMDEEEDNS